MSQFLFAKAPAAASDAADPQPKVPDRRWTILIVDDDTEVHAVTRLALGKVRFKDRGLDFVSAYSGEEAERILRERQDIAVILLDVVMETEDAGLRLVKKIRHDLNNRPVRIILRTGQPGQAPEESVILDYDINDYKSKTELTAQKLFTAVVASLRSYEDIVALETNRRGLQQIIETSDSLFRVQSMKHFASGVLIQMASFLGVPPSGILCAQKGDLAGDDRSRPYVLAAAGPYEEVINKPLDGNAPNPRMLSLVEHCYARQASVYENGLSALYIPAVGEVGQEVVACVEIERQLSGMDRALLEVFASKLSVGFANVVLLEQLKQANATLEMRVVERTQELADANSRLERLAAQDHLTGAYNRRHFRTMAGQAISTARRQQRPISVMMIDLDHFKSINDTHGHAVGDETLKALVEVCNATLRQADILGRYGGEEFCVLLPETDLGTAQMVADRLRQALADAPMPSAPMSSAPISSAQDAFHITASIGVAAWHAHETGIEASLDRADQALYQAKRDGRNLVVVNPG